MININEMSILSLSFIGDAVHTLFVRDKILKSANLKAGGYHNLSSKICKASSQARVLDLIENELFEDEKEIAKRARNAKSHKAKNSTMIEYKKASALEAVFGYLYLLEKTGRYLINLIEN